MHSMDKQGGTKPRGGVDRCWAAGWKAGWGQVPTSCLHSIKHSKFVQQQNCAGLSEAAGEGQDAHLLTRFFDPQGRLVGEPKISRQGFFQKFHLVGSNSMSVRQANGRPMLLGAQ